MSYSGVFLFSLHRSNHPVCPNDRQNIKRKGGVSEIILSYSSTVSFLFYIIQQRLEYIHESYSYGKLNSREEILRFQFKCSARVYFLFIIILS